MANIKDIHSSKFFEWSTPWPVVKGLAHLLDIPQFDLDPCAEQHTAKAEKYYIERGCDQPWFGHVFINPPYNKTKDFLNRRFGNDYESATYLLPMRSDTKYWHKHAFDATYWFIFEGRIKFERAGYDGSPAFPSVALHFSNDICIHEGERPSVLSVLVSHLMKMEY